MIIWLNRKKLKCLPHVVFLILIIVICPFQFHVESAGLIEISCDTILCTYFFLRNFPIALANETNGKNVGTKVHESHNLRPGTRCTQFTHQLIEHDWQRTLYTLSIVLVITRPQSHKFISVLSKMAIEYSWKKYRNHVANQSFVITRQFIGICMINQIALLRIFSVYSECAWESAEWMNEFYCIFSNWLMINWMKSNKSDRIQCLFTSLTQYSFISNVEKRAQKTVTLLHCQFRIFSQFCHRHFPVLFLLLQFFKRATSFHSSISEIMTNSRINAHKINYDLPLAC